MARLELDLVAIILLITDILFFFFFQAEDGIRDSSVTGVQTCALPISEAINASLLFRVLSDMAKGGNEQQGVYQLEQYNVEEAFKQIDSSTELSLEQK